MLSGHLPEDGKNHLLVLFIEIIRSDVDSLVARVLGDLLNAIFTVLLDGIDVLGVLVDLLPVDDTFGADLLHKLKHLNGVLAIIIEVVEEEGVSVLVLDVEGVGPHSEGSFFSGVSGICVFFEHLGLFEEFLILVVLGLQTVLSVVNQGSEKEIKLLVSGDDISGLNGIFNTDLNGVLDDLFSSLLEVVIKAGFIT